MRLERPSFSPRQQTCISIFILSSLTVAVLSLSLGIAMTTVIIIVTVVVRKLVFLLLCHNTTTTTTTATTTTPATTTTTPTTRVARLLAPGGFHWF